MKVPILKVPFTAEDKEFITTKIEEVLDSGMLTMGKYTKEFEDLFSLFTGAKYALSVSNCTAAIELIIRALGIEGKSIIVPTNTFLATAFAVMHSGNRVIFVDSDPKTFSIEPEDLKRKLTKDTAAVILVHVGGIITPDYYKIKEICEKLGLELIEDCAHAHGCSIDGKQAGTLGVAGAFSFFPTKVLVSGEGGMITTNSEELYNKAAMIRNHGKNPQMGNKMSEAGYNYRISEITAVIGVQQMKKAGDIIKERRQIASWYDELVPQVNNLTPVEIPKNVVSTYYKYIAYLPEKYDRTEVKRIMKEKYDVALTGEVYADLCHNEPLWEKYTYCGKQKTAKKISCDRWPKCGCDKKQDNFPGAEYLSKHHICLPLYPTLKKEEAEYVIASLNKTLNQDLRKGGS